MARKPYRSSGGFSGESLEIWLQNKLRNMQSGVESAVKDAVDKGSDTTKHLIESRGTAKSGKRGRVETGKMRDAVGSTMEASPFSGHIRGRFGWIDEREPYFRYQEQGFTHASGVDVEGMYALVDAAEYVMRDLNDEIRGAIKNA